MSSGLDRKSCRDSEPWIGRVHVRVKASAEKSSEEPLFGIGAYVNVVAMARSERDYRQLVTSEMYDDLNIIGFEEIETVAQREKFGTISDDILGLVAEISQSKPVLYDSFHCYDADDA